MRKMILFAVAASMIGFVSCNKDDESYEKFSIGTYNYVSNTGAGVAQINPTVYSWTVNYGKGMMEMANSGVNIGVNTVKVNVSNIKYQSAVVEFEGHAGSYFKGSLANGSDAGSGMEINDLKFELTPVFYLPPMALEYTADASAGIEQPNLSYSIPGGNFMSYTLMSYRLGPLCRVRTFWPDLVMKGETKTSVNGVAGSEFSSEEITYRLKIDTDKNRAVLVMYDVKFNPNMPSMNALIVPGLRVRALDEGFEIDGMDINPLYIEGGKLMENPSFPFNSIHFVSNDDLTGGTLDFTVAGRFTGQFTGKGVLKGE